MQTDRGKRREKGRDKDRWNQTVAYQGRQRQIEAGTRNIDIYKRDKHGGTEAGRRETCMCLLQ